MWITSLWRVLVAKPTGFLEFDRTGPRRRPVPVRLRDWREVYEPFEEDESKNQAARCMDCGIPFCHEGCPLGNLIPEFNDLVFRGDWAEAAERLHSTNNFPEFTGRLCPAPCEGSCVLGISQQPVAIERTEYEIAERAWNDGLVRPLRASRSTGKAVAVVGSGPAGLAVAQQLGRAGHRVVVFERGEQPGGLLRFGIPEFKMEKSILDRRLAQLDEEGIEFRCSVEVGGLGLRMGSRSSECVSVSLAELESEFDAIVLAIGSTIPRDLTIPGRDLAGIYPAMEYLKPANMVQGSLLPKHPIDAKDAHVVIIGGGDTGADCLGTAHRQGALSVTQLEIMPQPPETRSSANPWPTWPMIFRTSSAHEEGGERLYSVTTTEFVGSDGRVSALRGQRVEMVDAGDGRMNFEAVPGSAFELKADLVLLALGFSGPETTTVAAGLTLTQHGTIEADESWATSKPGVFVCGDATRGQSLIVWAIAEGRSAARSVDTFLMGESDLPSPVVPGQVAIR